MPSPLPELVVEPAFNQRKQTLKSPRTVRCAPVKTFQQQDEDLKQAFEHGKTEFIKNMNTSSENCVFFSEHDEIDLGCQNSSIVKFSHLMEDQRLAKELLWREAEHTPSTQLEKQLPKLIGTLQPTLKRQLVEIISQNMNISPNQMKVQSAQITDTLRQHTKNERKKPKLVSIQKLDRHMNKPGMKIKA